MGGVAVGVRYEDCGSQERLADVDKPLVLRWEARRRRLRPRTREGNDRNERNRAAFQMLHRRSIARPPADPPEASAVLGVVLLLPSEEVDITFIPGEVTPEKVTVPPEEPAAEAETED